MRSVVRNRLLYIATAIGCYVLGFQLLPDAVSAGWASTSVIVASVGYFVLLPLLYWLLVIRPGSQKTWKLILVYSISSLMAHYSFPAEQAAQFDFILLLRYPLMLVLVLFEFYVIFSVIKGLWQGRKLKGDPRINIINQYQDEDLKKRSTAITIATEPACWYYAIPKFSRNEAVSAYHINLLSAKKQHWLLLMACLGLISVMVFYLLVQWSEVGAYFISALILYGVVLLTANHRLSRYHSLYFHNGQLVINNSILGFLLVNFADITQVSHVNIACPNNEDELRFGRGENANIHITFKHPQVYYGGAGALPKTIKGIFLRISHPQTFMHELTQALAVKAQHKPAVPTISPEESYPAGDPNAA